jgi:hypothetical protein
MSPRRTYVVSVYEGEPPVVVVEAVLKGERARLPSLEELAAQIRDWEAQATAPAVSRSSAAASHSAPSH